VTNFAIVTIFTDMIKKYIPLISIVLLMAVAGCSAFSSAEKKAEYPQQPDDIRRNRAGSLLGSNNFKIFSSDKKESEPSEGTKSKEVIAVNAYLWRASLDTLSFMPLASADPLGGVIITDWYENPEVKGERFKVNVLISDKNLRSNAVTVSAFKQISTSGSWRDATVNEKVARDLENKILTRARELRLEKESK